MSGSKSCFFICIQISQEGGQVIWCSHLLKNFPHFVVIHTVKGFGLVIKEKYMLFWSSLAFSMIQQALPIWSLVPLPFLNPFWKSRSLWSMYCWSPGWRILSITLLACEMSAIMWWFEHSLSLPFFGIGMKTDLFQFCGHCWVFQICWYIECSTFTESSFRIWNSSAGIPSPPLVLFIVMLPKAHLTLRSRMYGSAAGLGGQPCIKLLERPVQLPGTPGSTAIAGAWITLPDREAGSGGTLISHCSLAR